MAPLLQNFRQMPVKVKMSLDDGYEMAEPSTYHEVSGSQTI